MRDGGWLAVSCWTQISEQPPFAAFATALAGRGWTVEAAAIGVPFSLFDPGDLVALAEQAGFGAIRIETVTLQVVLPPARVWADGYAHVPPFAGAYQAATPEDREAFLSHVENQLSAFATASGVAAPMTSNILLASAPVERVQLNAAIAPSVGSSPPPRIIADSQGCSNDSQNPR